MQCHVDGAAGAGRGAQTAPRAPQSRRPPSELRAEQSFWSLPGVSSRWCPRPFCWIAEVRARDILFYSVTGSLGSGRVILSLSLALSLSLSLSRNPPFSKAVVVQEAAPDALLLRGRMATLFCPVWGTDSFEASGPRRQRQPEQKARRSELRSVDAPRVP